LTTQTLTLNGVAEHFEISRPAVSKHIKILSECGLVTVEQEGRERYCMLKPEKLTEVSDWLEQYRTLWETKLNALEAYLKELQQSEKNDGRP
jgi:DNA-binding transcriptional ArsR family regulator